MKTKFFSKFRNPHSIWKILFIGKHKYCSFTKRILSKKNVLNIKNIIVDKAFMIGFNIFLTVFDMHWIVTNSDWCHETKFVIFISPKKVKKKELVVECSFCTKKMFVILIFVIENNAKKIVQSSYLLSNQM